MKVLLFAALAVTAASTSAKDVAFFYGNKPPVPELSFYDWVVIDAGNARGSGWQVLAEGATVFCYLSVGEAQGERSRRHRALVVGENPAWNAKVMDVASPAWRRVLVEEAAALKADGCEGLFLDTLDSYKLAFSEEQWPTAEAGLADIVTALAAAEPDLEILLNRGFEIYDRVSGAVVGMAIEGLYNGWHSTEARYKTIAEDERRWLVQQLSKVEAANGQVVVIDYLPPGATDEARRALADKIAAHGYTAWVTDVSLMHLGVSRFTHLPREVALIYDPGTSDFAGNDAHILLGAVLDYYGFNVVPYEVSSGLPVLVRGQHAGVITWLDAEPQFGPDDRAWLNWFAGAMDQQIPFAMFGVPPTLNGELLNRLGLARIASTKQASAELVSTTPGYGDFEAPAAERGRVPIPLQNRRDTNRPWVTMSLDGEPVAPVLTGGWGGYAQHPYLLQAGFSGSRRWLLDPFQFIEQALKIAPAPIPDTTTESGQRILLSHVDGDGFPSRAELPGTPFSAQVLYEQVFKPIELPHTVSVIEGEVAAHGLFPALSDDLELWARRIFALGNVEIASHSFSHPFFWSRRDRVDTAKTLYGLGLPIPGYATDMRREVVGSADYIDEHLAPENKRTKVFLWTGDAVPDGPTVDIVRERGLVNLNGGNTQIRKAFPSVTNVYPQSRWTSGGQQIYAPIMNENVYTNDWTGPFHGFRRVTETFERTDTPRRLKPMSIYYHFYSGTKPGALNALLEVYGYAQAQPHNALYISEFAERVAGYHTARMVRRADGAIEAAHLGALRTLRLPKSVAPPNVARSQGVAGWRSAQDGAYVHLWGDHVVLRFDEGDSGPRLVKANAKVVRWDLTPSGANIHLRGHEPIELTVAGTNRCRMALPDGREIASDPTKEGQRFALALRSTGDATLSCAASR